MLQRIFFSLLWLAAHFNPVYVNKASEQEAIGHGSSEASKPSFSHLNVSRLLFVSSMESPDRRKLSLFCLFNTRTAVGCVQCHPGKWSVPRKSMARWGFCLTSIPGTGTAAGSGCPTPSVEDPLQGQGEFPNLLAFCLEEDVPGSLSIPYQPVLAGLMLSRVDNHAYGSRGTWAFLGQPLAPFMSLSSGPTLSLAMGETPARLCLQSGGWGRGYSHMCGQ